MARFTVDASPIRGNADFASAIREILDEYKDEVNDIIDENISYCAKEGRKTLRQKFRAHGNNFYKTWSYKKVEHGGFYKEYLIYSKTPGYRIAHLLENGHQKVGSKSSERTRALGYVKEVESWILANLPKFILEDIKNI